MTFNIVPWQLWLRRVGVGILFLLVAVPLFIPATICSMLYEVGAEIEEDLRRRRRK